MIPNCARRTTVLKYLNVRIFFFLLLRLAWEGNCSHKQVAAILSFSRAYIVWGKWCSGRRGTWQISSRCPQYTPTHWQPSYYLVIISAFTECEKVGTNGVPFDAPPLVTKDLATVESFTGVFVITHWRYPKALWSDVSSQIQLYILPICEHVGLWNTWASYTSLTVCFMGLSGHGSLWMIESRQA